MDPEEPGGRRDPSLWMMLQRELSPLPEHLAQEARGLSTGRSQALGPGSVVAGYRLLAELGRGGMGVVFRAKHPSQPREVAIKILRSVAASPAQRERFRREVAAQIRLRHRNIVAALDSGEHEGKPYLVMELVEGPTLQELLKRGPLRPENAVRITHKLALALQHAHAHNVLHRDLKAANVILDSSGEPRLADFGLTKDMDVSLSRTALSQAGGLMGTPGYWSPEQARGDLDSIGSATDIYGLGAILYALLTGFPPHGQATSVMEAVARVVREDPDPPSVARPELDKALDPICLRCLARSPQDRYPTAAALAEALAQVQWETRTRPSTRGRLLLWGAGVFLALVCALGGASLAWRSREVVGAKPIELPQTEPAPESEVERLREQARAYTETGDYRAALETYTRALELEPEDPQTHGSRGYIYDVLGDYPAAYEDYTRAIALRPAFAPYYSSRGMVQAQRGEHSDALDDFTRALKIDPDHWPSYINRAGLLTRLGEFQRALDDYNRVLELDPESATAYHGRGALRGQMGDMAGCVEDCTRAIDLDPGEVGAYCNRGIARERLGDYEGAAEDCRRALRLLPPDDSARETVQAVLERVRGQLGRDSQRNRK